MFGVCKKCHEVRKYLNVDVKKISAENLKQYTCARCLINEINRANNSKNAWVEHYSGAR